MTPRENFSPTPPDASSAPLPPPSSPTSAASSSAQDVEVVDEQMGETDEGRAGARDAMPGGGEVAGGEVGTQSQQSDDLGVILRQSGLRAKAISKLDRMLDAKRFVWDPKANEGKGGYKAEDDFVTQMKAIQEVLNRSDGMPAQRSEILQALVKVGGAKEEAGNIELTPATRKVLEEMLKQPAKGSKKTGGTLPGGKR